MSGLSPLLCKHRGRGIFQGVELQGRDAGSLPEVLFVPQTLVGQASVRPVLCFATCLYVPPVLVSVVSRRQDQML